MEQAVEMYKDGMREENRGFYNDAVTLYSRALRVYPDVEKVIAQLASSNMLDDLEEEDCGKEFDMSVPTRDSAPSLCLGKTANCEVVYQEEFLRNRFNDVLCVNPMAETPDNKILLSDLPSEILLLVFRYVVGTNVELRSLEMLAKVCRRFYLLARDENLWRRIAYRIWTFSTSDDIDSPEFRLPPLEKRSEDPTESSLASCYGPYKSWRQLVLQQPHLYFDGVYFSKIDFDHLGGMSLDLKPRLSYNVTVIYYRVFKFDQNGCVIMVTSPLQNPDSIIELIDNVARSFGSGPPSTSTPDGTTTIKMGTFNWIPPNKVECVFKTEDTKDSRFSSRRSGRRNMHDPGAVKEFERRIVLEISSTRRRLHNVLSWTDYSLMKRNDFTEAVDVVKIETQKSIHFRPLYYARVKRYLQRTSSKPV